MKTRKHIPIIILLAFYGCIGTDFIEEVIVPMDLSISRSTDSVQVGASYTFQADYFNEFGQKEDVSVDWSSSNPAIISINSLGAADALAEGNAYIIASFSSLRDSVLVGTAGIVTPQIAERTGVFVGNRDYAVKGSFALRENGNSLELSFGTDFTASNGPGLFVYLSNSQNSVAGGVEAGKLKRNSGAQNYLISMSQAQLNSYKYVLIYCKPFGIPFGIGTFTN